MSFGVTLTGFVTKRLADIASETDIDWKEAFGAAFDLDPRTPEGQVKGILDERESLIWELAEDVYNCGTASFSEGVCLDNNVALVGLARLGSVKSKVIEGRAFGVLATIVPAGTIISVVGDTTARFETLADSTIVNAAIDQVEKISFDTDPDAGKFNIIFPEGTSADIAHDDSIPTIQGILDAVLGGGNSVVSGALDDATGLTITFGGTLGGLPRTALTITGNTLTSGGPATVATPSITTAGSKPSTNLIILEAETAGPVAALTGTLTVIETPTIGLEDFTNEADAIVGRLVEEDPALKLRRQQSVQIAGAATIEAIRADIQAVEGVTAVFVFENDMDIPDIDGLPPKTVRVVVQGGDDPEIAEQLFLTKAGGIGTVGLVEEIVTDSQGFTRTIRFDRPSPIDVFFEIDLVVDTSFFPSDGLALVEAAILAYGNALTIGQDIIVFGSSSLSCSIDQIPGITDFDIRVSRDSGPPTIDDNIIISPDEISDWDSSRITAAIP